MRWPNISIRLLLLCVCIGICVPGHAVSSLCPVSFSSLVEVSQNTSAATGSLYSGFLDCQLRSDTVTCWLVAACEKYVCVSMSMALSESTVTCWLVAACEKYVCVDVKFVTETEIVNSCVARTCG